MHHTCDLELSPANPPEKMGYQEQDSTLQPLLLSVSNAEITVFTIKVTAM